MSGKGDLLTVQSGRLLVWIEIVVYFFIDLAIIFAFGPNANFMHILCDDKHQQFPVPLAQLPIHRLCFNAKLNSTSNGPQQ